MNPVLLVLMPIMSVWHNLPEQNVEHMCKYR